MTTDFSPERSMNIISSILFVVMSTMAVKKVRKDRFREDINGRAFYPDNSDAIDEGNTNNSSNVSSRCMNALAPATPYLLSFLRGLDCLCTPERPDGYIPLCMAENKLSIDLLSARLQTPSTTLSAFSDPIVYCYNSFLGLPLARQAVSYFLAKRFLHIQNHDINLSKLNLSNEPIDSARRTSFGIGLDTALQCINPAHIGIGSGAVGILNSLFYLLSNAGDACLIPAPYYAAFESDLRIIAGVIPFAVYMANPTHGPSANELDSAFIEARSQGLNPKFVLITNPNNPLGVVYSKTVMLNIIDWARKRQVHTIVDEIYALSTHQKNGHGFESIIKILKNKLGNDVHFVWSISKDFGASGLRFGIVYTQNETFLDGLANLNIFSGVSNPIQMVVSELLTDDKFIDMYLEETQARLHNSYCICTAKLEEMVLPFVPAVAGQFVYVDFGSLLPEKTVEWERRLSQLFIDHARLILTPGESQRERIPGMFRICYAWVQPEILEIGMERLSRVVAKIRRMDWSDLNESSLSGVIV